MRPRILWCTARLTSGMPEVLFLAARPMQQAPRDCPECTRAGGEHELHHQPQLVQARFRLAALLPATRICHFLTNLLQRGEVRARRTVHLVQVRIQRADEPIGTRSDLVLEGLQRSAQFIDGGEGHM